MFQCANPTGRVESEIYFRFVSAADSEQAVEFTIGPKGAFGTGNIATLTRRVPIPPAVSVVPLPRRKPKPPMEPKPPRVTELLRKAIQWHSQIESDQIANQAQIAQQEGITRARVTQVMSLLRLNPEIQEAILAMSDSFSRTHVTEHALRPITQFSAREQVEAFRELMGLQLPHGP